MTPKKTAKKTASKRSPSARKKRTDRTSVQLPEDRLYPDLKPEHETAARLVADGHSMETVGKAIGVGKSTIHDWLKIPAVNEAFETERELRMREVRQSFAGTIDAAGRALRHQLERGSTKAGTALHGRLALAVLKESGYLPKSKEKESEDRKKSAMLQEFLSDLGALADDGMSDGDEDQ